MDSLRKLQTEFAAAVLEGIDEYRDYGIEASGLSAARRLQVYKNNLYISLTDALIAIYSVTHRLVGDDFFRHIAMQYIPMQPSKSGNLHEFGERFPQYLRSLQAIMSLPYLPDVAELEWVYHRVFHSAHAEPLQVEELQKLPAQYHDDLYFKLHPACQLIKSDYPILEIWLSNQGNYEGDGLISLEKGSVSLAVVRPELEIEFQSLSAGDFVLLNEINNGSAFFIACEHAVQVEPDMDVAQCLYRHIQRKTIVDYFVKEENPISDRI